MSRALTFLLCAAALGAQAQDSSGDASGASLMERMFLTPLEREMLDDQDVQACDSLAGSPNHPDRETGAMLSLGRIVTAIDGGLAEPRCRAALDKFPQHPRLMAALGDALFVQGRQQEAFALYRSAADLGDPVGQASLGTSYYYGWGVARSHKEALYWMRQSEAAGNPVALVGLGLAHQEGNGVAKDIGAALRYYEAAHAAGNPYGSSLLGRMYEYGQGVPRDPERAADLYITGLTGGATWVYESKRQWTNRTGVALQRRLRDLGHYDGAIDGAIGPASRAAMQALWEASH